MSDKRVTEALAIFTALEGLEKLSLGKTLPDLVHATRALVVSKVPPEIRIPTEQEVR